ncbi:MAG: hypothetical protein AAGJ93_13265 [Bacteroidota bacterium]
MSYRIVLLSLLFLPCCFLLAQQEEQLDFVYLYGDNFLKGKIIDTVDQHYIRLNVLGDSTLLIPMRLIKEVESNKISFLREAEGRFVQSDGFFWELAGQFLTAESAVSDIKRLNIGFQFNGGYYVKPWLSLGGGFGLDRYEQVVMPVFTQIRMYVPDRLTTPYLGFQFGRGLAVEQLFNRDEFDDSRGGWMWYPSLGLRIASHRDADFHIDMGYKFQQLTEEFNFPDDWWHSSVSEKTTFQSFSLRLGCTF